MIKVRCGYSLIISFFLIIFISIISLSLLSTSTNTLKTSANEEVDQSVYYITEAGINYIESLLKKEVQVAKSNAYTKVVAAYNKIVASATPVPIDFNTIYEVELKKELRNSFNAQFVTKDIDLLTSGVQLEINQFDKRNNNSSPKAQITIKYDIDYKYEVTSVVIIEKKERKLTREFNVLPDTIVGGGSYPTP